MILIFKDQRGKRVVSTEWTVQEDTIDDKPVLSILYKILSPNGNDTRYEIGILYMTMSEFIQELRNASHGICNVTHRYKVEV